MTNAHTRCDECGTRDASVRHVETDTHNCNACERCVPVTSQAVFLSFPVKVPSAEVYVARWQLPGASVAPGDSRWGGASWRESVAMVELMETLRDSLRGEVRP